MVLKSREEMTEEEVIEYCKGYLASYKRGRLFSWTLSPETHLKKFSKLS